MRFVILASLLLGVPLLADTSVEPAKLRIADSKYECDATQCDTYITIKNLTPNRIDVVFEIRFVDKATIRVGEKYGIAVIDPGGEATVFEEVRITAAPDQMSARARIIDHN
jgi:hypothetical protein